MWPLNASIDSGRLARCAKAPIVETWRRRASKLRHVRIDEGNRDPVAMPSQSAPDPALQRTRPGRALECGINHVSES
jgi:hypothetical protein